MINKKAQQKIEKSRTGAGKEIKKMPKTRHGKPQTIEYLAGIDTVEARSDTETTKTKEEAPYMSIRSRKGNTLNTLGKSYYILNPDKANGGETVYVFSEYNNLYVEMTDELGLTNTKKTRIDMRFDDLKNNYLINLKLNKLLLLLVAREYNIRNSYQSTNLFTQEALTSRIQNRDFEAEYYNKAAQEPWGNVQARFELRTKRFNDNIKEADKEVKAFNDWQRRFAKSVTDDNFLSLQEDINKELVGRYNETIWLGMSMTVSNLVSKYEDSIYSLQQLAQLLEMLGEEHPQQQAQYYKKIKAFRPFFLSDVSRYVSIIKKSGTLFLKN